MNYECKCKPIQKYPHIVRGYNQRHWWLSIPRSKSKRLSLICLEQRLSPAKSCDNHPVPVKRWGVRFWLGKRDYLLEFGKIIY